MRFGLLLSSVCSFISLSSVNSLKSVLRKQCKSTMFMRVKNNFDSSFDTRSISPLYKPKTENQKLYVKHLIDDIIPIVLGVGPAGSGKTLFACNQAVLALKKKEIQKIILTRPVVPVEEDIGFLPGNLIHKMDPWTRPVFDILLEYYSQKDIDSMLHGGVLEISPLAFMRGRTFKNAFIIADEMQNSSPNQMLMLTTRIGDKSKLVITGDLQQSDRGVNNGLADFLNKIKKYNDYCLKSDIPIPNIRIVEMNSVDIQRSAIVSKLLEIYKEPVLNQFSFNMPPSGAEMNGLEQLPCASSMRKGSNHVAPYYNDASLLPASQIDSNSTKFPWNPKPI